MMRKLGFAPGLLLVAVLLSAGTAAAFDIDYELDAKHAPGIRIEKPTPGRNFGQNVVSYLRFVPAPGKNRVYPAFITTRNYLTCPDTGARTPLNEVKQVSNDWRSGIKVLGFFFPNPNCDNPKFHIEPVLGG